MIHTTDDGIRIHAEVHGTGTPALVLVHGWCSNLRHWDAQVEHFARRHRVLTVDRRGHGRSDAPDPAVVPYTAARHAADLAGVLDAAGITDAVVVAHAGGAPGALVLATSRPDLVRGLALIEAIVSPASRVGDPEDPAGAALGAMIDAILAADGAAAFARIYATFFGPHAGPVAPATVADAARVPRPVAAAELRSLSIDTDALARALTVPVLWLTAANADEAALGLVLGDGRFGRVVESGHFPHLEVPDQVNAMIERFVATVT